MHQMLDAGQVSPSGLSMISVRGLFGVGIFKMNDKCDTSQGGRQSHQCVPLGLDCGVLLIAFCQIIPRCWHFITFG